MFLFNYKLFNGTCEPAKCHYVEKITTYSPPPNAKELDCMDVGKEGGVPPPLEFD